MSCHRLGRGTGANLFSLSTGLSGPKFVQHVSPFKARSGRSKACEQRRRAKDKGEVPVGLGTRARQHRGYPLAAAEEMFELR